MSEAGRLQSDPLFQGLTRPPMLAGVSYMYFVINAIVAMLVFIWSKNFIMILVVAPAIHCIGYLICMKEPRAVELLMLRGQFGYMNWNNLLGYHHGLNSYDTF